MWHGKNANQGITAAFFVNAEGKKDGLEEVADCRAHCSPILIFVETFCADDKQQTGEVTFLSRSFST